MSSPPPVTFYPLGHDTDHWENRTGLWVCPRWDPDPSVDARRQTRLSATREAVTGGVALRVAIPKGSRGVITCEHSPFPAGMAGLTLYAKASEPLVFSIKGAPFSVGTAWRKIDLSWGKLGTTPGERNIGYEWTVGLAEPARRDAWVIFDRVGAEGPRFDPAPAISPTRGPDAPPLPARDIVGNAAVLAPTVRRLRAHEPFKIVAFGDSVTAGAQSFRGNWEMQQQAVDHLYFARLARLLAARFRRPVPTYVQKGYGGWTAAQARTVVEDVLREVGPNDLLVLEFGANDLGWAGRSVDDWLADLAALVAAGKKKTSQIVVLTPTTGGGIPKHAPAVSSRIREFARRENVAFVDITRWSLARGEPFAWAYLANEYHPDFMGHALIAEQMLPLFPTGKP